MCIKNRPLLLPQTSLQFLISHVVKFNYGAEETKNSTMMLEASEVPEKRTKSTKAKSSRQTLSRFGDHGGYFDVVVRPMLQQGHEGELCGWLKEMSLIRTVVNCPNDNCQGKSLQWCPARIVDKYSWSCMACSRKQSIREGSFFFGIKCDLKMCLQIILGWCQVISSEQTASYLDIKKHVVKKVYDRCDEISENYVKNHPEEWVLGGQSAILLVDEFPYGYMSEELSSDMSLARKRNNNSHTMLCIAEINTMPVKMWLHMMEAAPEPMRAEKSTHYNRSNIVREALREISRHTVTGSYLIANNRAGSCSYDALQELKQYKVFSVEHLQKFDPPGMNRLLDNLETIWKSGVEICEEIQEETYTTGKRVISRYLWRQKFGTSASTAFQYMLNHIAEYFQLNSHVR